MCTESSLRMMTRCILQNTYHIELWKKNKSETIMCLSFTRKIACPFRYFQCNHVLSKEDEPFVLLLSTLPKEFTWHVFRKVRISLSNKWKILNSDTHLKSENSYEKSFTLVKKQLLLIIKLLRTLAKIVRKHTISFISRTFALLGLPLLYLKKKHI